MCKFVDAPGYEFISRPDNECAEEIEGGVDEGGDEGEGGGEESGEGFGRKEEDVGYDVDLFRD